MNQRENALRIISFDQLEFVAGNIPCYNIAYLGCDHEVFQGGGHHLSLSSKWIDI